MVSKMEYNDNIYIKEFITENRTGGEVQSLTIKAKAFKKDAIPIIAGSDGTTITYTDQSLPIESKTSKTYYDFNNATVILSKTFTYSVPEADRTSDSHESADSREYTSKVRLWVGTYNDAEDYATFFTSFFTELEALDVSW